MQERGRKYPQWRAERLLGNTLFEMMLSIQEVSWAQVGRFGYNRYSRQPCLNELPTMECAQLYFNTLLILL